MPNDYEVGVSAVEEIVKRVFRVNLTKALDPTNPHDFLVILKRLSDAVRGTTGPAQASAIQQALDVLDVDWPRISDKGRDEVIEAARRALYLPKTVVEHTLTIFAKTGKEVVTTTKKATATRFKLDIKSTFTAQDDRVVKHAAESQAHYFRNSEGDRVERFAQKARDIVAKGVGQGLGRVEIGQDLKKALNSYADRSDSYWRMVAGVHINRSRTFAQLSSYQDSSIENYVFEAVMDEVTSVQCRFMDGKTFPVAHALKRYEQVAAAKDPEDVRHIQPWIQSKKDGLYVGDHHLADVEDNALGRSDDAGAFTQHLTDKQLEALGCTVPPLHGNCRSTIVPDL